MTIYGSLAQPLHYSTATGSVDPRGLANVEDDMASNGMCDCCGKKTMDLRLSLAGFKLVCGNCSVAEMRRFTFQPRSIARIPRHAA